MIKKKLKSLSFGMALLLLFQLLIPITILAEETLAPSLSMNSEGNYTVSSVADLNTLRSDIDKGINYAGKTILLTQDIDLSQAAVPLNSFTTQNTFSGCFNGKFHTISGYTDARSGLISLVADKGCVENLRVVGNVVINDASSIINGIYYEPGLLPSYGLIANESAGIITRCSTTGTVTTNDYVTVGGIAGNSVLYTQVDGAVSTLKGILTNSFSNVIFNNQTIDGDNYTVLFAGICWFGGDIIEHCYFYGQYTGNTLPKGQKMQIKRTGGSAKTCAYDSEMAVGCYGTGTAMGVKYTTAQMKEQASYTALGFDFDECWSIDSAINDGYPYLDPLKEDKAALVKVQVDIQVTVADKTYDAALSEAENLKAEVTKVQVVAPTPEIADLIAQYHVQADYTVKSATLSSRMGEWPVKVVFDKLDLTYDSNDAYEFTINEVLPTTAKYLENGQPGPIEAEQAEQVELAKKAQDILYNALQSGQGDVPAFTWVGDKATASGKEGTIVFNNDPWGIFSPARSGYTGVRSGYYDDWFQSVQTGLQAMKDAGIGDQDVKMTEWEKLVLAITAIGYDPRDIKAYDLIDIISNQTYQSASHQIMCYPYAGFALDSYNYPTPDDGNRIDKDAYIHGWAAQIIEAGQNLTDSSYVRAYDLALMQVQPLAAYYNPNAQEGDPYYDVKVAMEMLLARYSAAQTDIGYFYSGSYPDENEWNNAQVYIFLGMAKINPFEARYIKNGFSMFDGALSYYNFEEGTCPYNNTSTYEPGQMGRGLDSLVRAYEGRNSIFDCTDVADSTVPVNNAIEALPETITSANKAEVEAAQALYDALSDAKKASIQDSAKAKLAAAQQALGGETDQAAADVVIAQIEDLPVAEAVTLADQGNVQAARTAYDALSEAQKVLVTNLAKLTAAEARLAELQTGASLAYQKAAIDAGKKTVTLTFNRAIFNNKASLEELKNAVTYAVDGANYTTLNAADQVSIAGNTLVVSFNTALTGNGNKLKLAAGSLKDGAGNVLNSEITSEALDAGQLDECFIATAAFGSKYQPDVVLLRQFRDHCLLSNSLGQAFVKFYYKHSPPIANFIAHSEGLRVTVRAMLIPLVVIAYMLLHPGVMIGVLAVGSLTIAELRRKKRNPGAYNT